MAAPGQAGQADQADQVPTLSPMQSIVLEEALHAGINPALGMALVDQESGFNPNAVNPQSGVTGLAQVTLDTGRPYGLTEKNRTDPRVSARAGMQYFRSLLDKNQGDVGQSLVQYNGGTDPGYVQNVMGKYPKYQYLANVRLGTPSASAASASASASAASSPPSVASPSPDTSSLDQVEESAPDIPVSQQSGETAPAQGAAPVDRSLNELEQTAPEVPVSGGIPESTDIPGETREQARARAEEWAQNVNALPPAPTTKEGFRQAARTGVDVSLRMGLPIAGGMAGGVPGMIAGGLAGNWLSRLGGFSDEEPLGHIGPVPMYLSDIAATAGPAVVPAVRGALGAVRGIARATSAGQAVGKAAEETTRLQDLATAHDAAALSQQATATEARAMPGRLAPTMPARTVTDVSRDVAALNAGGAPADEIMTRLGVSTPAQARSALVAERHTMVTGGAGFGVRPEPVIDPATGQPSFNVAGEGSVTGQLYNRFFDNVGGSRVDQTPVLDTIHDVSARVPHADSELQAVVKNIQDEGVMTTGGTVRNNMKVIGDYTNSDNPASNAVANRLYKSYYEAMRDSLAPERVEMLEQAHAAHKQDMAVNMMEKALKKTGPDAPIHTDIYGRTVVNFPKLQGELTNPAVMDNLSPGAQAQLVNDLEQARGGFQPLPSGAPPTPPSPGGVQPVLQRPGILGNRGVPRTLTELAGVYGIGSLHSARAGIGLAAVDIAWPWVEYGISKMLLSPSGRPLLTRALSLSGGVITPQIAQMLRSYATSGSVAAAYMQRKRQQEALPQMPQMPQP